MAKLTNLQILNLCKIEPNEVYNNIGDAGAREISKIHKIRELHLCKKCRYAGDNNIGAEGIAALCRLTNLKLLIISKNQLN